MGQSVSIEVKPPAMQNDCRELVAILSNCLVGVMEKKMEPAQANAVCNLVHTALKVLEMEHRQRTGR